MVKKFLIAIVVFASSIVFAQNQQKQQIYETQRTIRCGDKNLILQILNKDFNEVPVFYGEDEENEKVKYGITLNLETGAWTIIHFNEKTACILGSGSKASVSDALIQHHLKKMI
jgi:hypothetical protein